MMEMEIIKAKKLKTNKAKEHKTNKVNVMKRNKTKRKINKAEEHKANKTKERKTNEAKEQKSFKPEEPWSIKYNNEFQKKIPELEEKGMAELKAKELEAMTATELETSKKIEAGDKMHSSTISLVLSLFIQGAFERVDAFRNYRELIDGFNQAGELNALERRIVDDLERAVTCVPIESIIDAQGKFIAVARVIREAEGDLPTDVRPDFERAIEILKCRH